MPLGMFPEMLSGLLLGLSIGMSLGTRLVVLEESLRNLGGIASRFPRGIPGGILAASLEAL